MRTRLFVPSGTPSQASGGEISSPSQVYFGGIWPSCSKAGEVRVMAITAVPDKLRENSVAIRRPTSLESRHKRSERDGIASIRTKGPKLGSASLMAS
jgi:hypothetical protein